jgi:hypothetical protein
VAISVRSTAPRAVAAGTVSPVNRSKEFYIIYKYRTLNMKKLSLASVDTTQKKVVYLHEALKNTGDDPYAIEYEQNHPSQPLNTSTYDTNNPSILFDISRYLIDVKLRDRVILQESGLIKNVNFYIQVPRGGEVNVECPFSLLRSSTMTINGVSIQVADWGEIKTISSTVYKTKNGKRNMFSHWNLSKNRKERLFQIGLTKEDTTDAGNDVTRYHFSANIPTLYLPIFGGLENFNMPISLHRGTYQINFELIKKELLTRMFTFKDASHARHALTKIVYDFRNTMFTFSTGIYVNYNPEDDLLAGTPYRTCVEKRSLIKTGFAGQKDIQLKVGSNKDILVPFTNVDGTSCQALMDSMLESSGIVKGLTSFCYDYGNAHHLTDSSDQPIIESNRAAFNNIIYNDLLQSIRRPGECQSDLTIKPEKYNVYKQKVLAFHVTGTDPVMLSITNNRYAHISITPEILKTIKYNKWSSGMTVTIAGTQVPTWDVAMVINEIKDDEIILYAPANLGNPAGVDRDITITLPLESYDPSLYNPFQDGVCSSCMQVAQFHEYDHNHIHTSSPDDEPNTFRIRYQTSVGVPEMQVKALTFHRQNLTYTCEGKNTTVQIS